MTNKLCWILATALASCTSPGNVQHETSTTVTVPDAYTLVGERSSFSGYAATNQSGALDVTIEISPGTNAKWEVDKQGAVLGVARGAPCVGPLPPRPLLPRQRPPDHGRYRSSWSGGREGSFTHP